MTVIFDRVVVGVEQRICLVFKFHQLQSAPVILSVSLRLFAHPLDIDVIESTRIGDRNGLFATSAAILG